MMSLSCMQSKVGGRTTMWRCGECTYNITEIKFNSDNKVIMYVSLKTRPTVEIINGDFVLLTP